MPALTRVARRCLQQCKDEDEPELSVLILREPVANKVDRVWTHRHGIDIYTGEDRHNTPRPQVDHVLECQLTEMALACIFQHGRQTRLKSMATAQAAEWLRDGVNGLGNLNVTSARINQAKRGPWTAALNRLRSEQLRDVSVEQMARQGRAKWMLEDGTWSRIQGAVVESFDALQSRNFDGLAAAEEVAAESIEELQRMLDRLGIL